MANTKLSTYEKEILRSLQEGAEENGVELMRLNDETVMAYKPRGNTVEFSLAVKSPDERKFRVKVGKYWALARFFEGNTVKMAKYDFMVMCEAVWAAYPFSIK